MTELFTWMGLTGAGAMIGGIYFGGLWWTTRRLPSTTRPTVWVMVSFLVRLGIVAAGFYWLMDGSALRAVPLLVGFVVTRGIMIRWIGPDRSNRRRTDGTVEPRSSTGARES